jgi:hypothetical protein
MQIQTLIKPLTYVKILFAPLLSHYSSFVFSLGPKCHVSDLVTVHLVASKLLNCMKANYKEALKKYIIRKVQTNQYKY